MRIVVCLTTIPSGYQGAKEVIEALLKQSRMPDKIYLHLPRIFKKTGEFYPKFDFSHPLLEIVYCKDKGPITKLYPVLEKEKDEETRIILADDDNIPNSEMIKTFEKYSKLHPDWVLSTGGWIRGTFPLMFQPMFKNKKEIRKVDWVEGAGYILIPRKHLDSQLLDYKKHIEDKTTRKLFKKHDDHWLSWYFKRKGVILATIPHNFFLRKAKGSKTYQISKSKGFLAEVYFLANYLSEKGIYKEKASFYPLPLTLIIISFLVLLIILIFLFLKFKNGRR